MKTIFGKKVLAIVILSLGVLVSLAQAPQGINYQAVIRNGSGTPIVDQFVGVEITLQNTAGTALYTETHRPRTNAQGVISITIGEGTLVGTIAFTSIPWNTGDVLVKVRIDPTGGIAYTQIGEPTELKSVPYALYTNPKEITSVPGADPNAAIFEVKNTLGQVVFGVYQSGVRVYVDDAAVKGAKGGFAVGGLSQTKAEPDEYLQIYPDSARVYLKPSTKGAKGGFAVGGLSQTKGLNKNFFNIETGDNYIINPSQARIIWYPLKNALLTGEVLIEDPANVGLNSFASGYKSKAKGQYSQALGYQASALGDYSTAIGKNVVANSNNSFAFGESSVTNSEYSYAFGKNAIANGQNSFAFGESVTAGTNLTTTNAYAFGRKSHAKANFSYAMGDSAMSNALYSFAFGRKAIANGVSSYAFGDGASTGIGANNSFAFGKTAQANGISSYSFGKLAQANGASSYALGDGATADGAGSFAFGSFGRDTTNFLPTTSPTTATGNYSFAVGLGAKSLGVSSTAIGILSIANGDASMALGVGSNASGSKSLALNSGQAVGNSSLAFGFMSKAQGDYSIAIGRGITKFGGVYNLAEGAYSIAMGYSRSKARNSIGIGSATIDAAADNGIGIGNSINIYGKYATGIGSLLTVNSYGAFVVGQANIDGGSPTAWNGTDPIFIVGNGLSPATPWNALTILKNGSMRISRDASYDVWIQGGAGALGDDRNLAFLGKDEDSGDKLYINYDGEYANGTEANGTFIVNGNVGITAAAPSLQIEKNISGNAAATIKNLNDAADANGLYITAGSSTLANARFINFYRPGNSTPIGSISQNALNTIAFNTSSDARIKENIIRTTFGINDLMNIQVHDFNFKNDPNKTKTTGFLAQELFKVYPDAVSKPATEDGIWQVDYGRITPLLVKAIQDQQQQINALKEENEQLKIKSKEIEALKAELEAIKNLLKK